MSNQTNQITLNGITLRYTNTTIAYNGTIVYSGTVNLSYLRAVSLILTTSVNNK